MSEAAAVTKRKPVVLPEREASKPIGVSSDTGLFVTLEEFGSDPAKMSRKLASLDSLGYDTRAEFTIARLRREPPDLKIGVIGGGVFSRDDIIDEVRKGSETGKEFIGIEQAWVERVKEKVIKGEYLLRDQVSASAQ